MSSICHGQACVFSSPITGTVNVNSNCDFNGDLTINEGTLTVADGVILIIDGKLINAQNSNLTALINGSGSIDVLDKYESKSNSILIFDGISLNISGEFDADDDNADITFRNGSSLSATKFKGAKNAQIVLNNATITLSDDFENDKDNSNLTVINSSITAVDLKTGKNSVTTINASNIALSGKMEVDKDNSDIFISNGSDIQVDEEIKTGKNSEFSAADSNLSFGGDFDADKDNTQISLSNSTLSVDGDYKASKNGSVNINGGSLSITGDFDNSKDNSDITIEGNGSLSIDGDFDNGKNSDIDIGSSGGGSISVGGNFDNSKENGDIVIGNGGNLAVGEDFENGKNGNINVEDGALLNIDGDLINEQDNGTVETSVGGTSIVGGTISDPDNGFTSAGGDTDCTNGCCGAGCDALPVELLRFESEMSDGDVTLKWLTASEINNKGFYIQQSLDGKKFIAIGFIKGHGNSDEVKSYYYRIIQYSETAYYRLKQIDYDGQFEKSKIIKVTKELSAFAKDNIQIGPNPLTQGDNIMISIPAAGEVNLQVYNVSGNEIAFIDEDEGSLVIEKLKRIISSLEKGIYIIRANQNGCTTNKKLVIK